MIAVTTLFTISFVRAPDKEVWLARRKLLVASLLCRRSTKWAPVTCELAAVGEFPEPRFQCEKVTGYCKVFKVAPTDTDPSLGMRNPGALLWTFPEYQTTLQVGIQRKLQNSDQVARRPTENSKRKYITLKHSPNNSISFSLS